MSAAVGHTIPREDTPIRSSSVTRTALIIVVLTSALYLPRLGDAPIYLAPDEVFIALHAHALATTGRDQGGRFLPLYVEYKYPGFDRNGKPTQRSGWLPPAIYYGTALAFSILPVSETSLRLPTAIVGILDVLLMYLVARRLFGSDAFGIAAAAALALTPAHFIHSRFAMDYLWPVPFTLAWLFFAITYFRHGRDRRLFTATAILGAGIYSYIASTIVMPMFFVLTLLALWREHQPVRAVGIAALGFLIPASLYVPWVIAHPGAGLDVLAKYGFNPGSGKELQAVSALLTFHGLGDQLSRLWAFFDPRFLFFDGSMELMYSTRTAGVFTLTLAPLLAIGIWSVLRGRVIGVDLMLLGGLILSPLPATILNAPDAIYRALEMLPFAVLLSVYGLVTIWTSPMPAPPRRLMQIAAAVLLLGSAAYIGASIALRGRMPSSTSLLAAVTATMILLTWLAPRFRTGQLAAIGLLALMPIQFAFFYADYMTNYRLRTTMIFSGNIRGALEETIREADQQNPPQIYLAKIGPYSRGGGYWSFYLIKHRRTDLEARTIDAGRFDRERVLQLRSGSLVVSNAGEGEVDAQIDRLVADEQLTRTPVREPDGVTTFWVLRRTARP